MTNVLSSLAGELLALEVSGGARFFAEDSAGSMLAVASRSGRAGWIKGDQAQKIDVQAPGRKTNFEAEVQGLWLSPTGDMLFAASSIDLLAVNTESLTMAWTYEHKRTFGFLASVPQDGFCTPEELWILYSSGEMVALDRKSRVVETLMHPSAPKMLGKSNDLSVIVGSDGHRIQVWEIGRNTWKPLLDRPGFSLGLSGDGSVLAVRGSSSMTIIEMSSGEVMTSWPCEPGLPMLAVDHRGELMATLSEGKVYVRSRVGTTVGCFELTGDFAISVYARRSGREFCVGTREGYVYQVAWPI
jgi:hypothetical protein